MNRIMIRATSILAVCFLLFTGGIACIKDTSCQDKTIQSEQAAITAYAAANSITGTAHASGLYYQVVSAGGGPTPTVNSQISVRYTGKLLNGTVFDSQTGTPVTFALGGTIAGWQIGLQQIQKGGVIKLIIPSSLAYGCGGKGPIPGDAILFFEVQLVDVL
ncbi:MAG: FKBP-type peptidyl-prolyl cis-trans isomerase [Ferruginibacter sp.]|nr:FKBP-type peptidyl-prolyl cis-trans isomerase [Chitinophagaceae bacterium]